MTPTMTVATRPCSGLLSLFLASCVLSIGCGDDGGGQDTDSGTDTEAGTGTTMGTTPTTDPTTGPTTDPTTTDPTTGPSTDPSTGTGTSTATGTSTDTDPGTGTGTGTAGLDCDAIPEGPFTATEVFADFEWDGSEDLAFDGAGQIVARRGTELVAVDAAQSESVVATGIPALYGLRYRPTGELLGAAYMAGNIIEVDDQGNVTNFAMNVGGVNGIYVDFDNVVWFTNFQQVVRVDDEGRTTIAMGADGANANGIVYDADRMLLFFTNYGTGGIRRVAIDADGAPDGPVSTIETIDGTSPDGMALDDCGNLYVVDQGGNMIYRLFLDQNGDPIGTAEALLDSPTDQNIANAQFGSGDGWDEDVLYAVGNPGVLYEIPVGVPGKPYPTPQ